MSVVQATSISIDDRLREDLGELGELMVSIQQYGLLHPVVIDDKRRLIAGYRRLEACKRLGKKRIEVKFYGELTDEERREIELEENVQRKDLTAYEASKLTTRRKEKAAEELAEDSSGKLPDESKKKKKKKRGGQKKPDSKDEIAKKSGKSRRDISRAEEHVAAGERYPFLQDRQWNQKAAIEMAKVLDEIGESGVKYLYRFCRNGHGSGPEEIRAFFQTWHSATAATRRKLRKRLDGSKLESSRTVSLMASCTPDPDSALVWACGRLREIRAMTKKREKRDALLPALRRTEKAIERFHAEAKGHNERAIEALRKELLA